MKKAFLSILPLITALGTTNSFALDCAWYCLDVCAFEITNNQSCWAECMRGCSSDPFSGPKRICTSGTIPGLP